MAFDNDKWKGFAWGDGGWPDRMSPLPTRSGQPSGKSNERVMLEKTPADTISRSVRGNTTLSTRGGMPHFSNEDDENSVDSVVGRWFSLRVGGKFCLFDPYTITLKHENVEPSRFGYRVAPFASSADRKQSFLWRDVWLIDELKRIYINNKVQPSITGTFVYHANDSDAAGKLPVFLGLPAPGNRFSTSYPEFSGTAFAVGRYSVAAMPDGSAVLMNGITERSESRARLCGPKISANSADASGTVELRQLVYTPPAWQALASGWFMRVAQVNLNKTAPHLGITQSVELVDRNLVVMNDMGTSTGTSSRTGSIPNVDLFCIAHGEVTQYASASDLHGWVYWYGDEILKGSVDTEIDKNYTRHTWQGSVSETGMMFGLTWASSGTNTLYADIGGEAVSVAGQLIDPFGFPNPGLIGTQTVWNTDDETYGITAHFGTPSDPNHYYDSAPHFGHHYSTCAVLGTPNFGYGQVTFPHGAITSCGYIERHQTGSYLMQIDSIDLVSVTFSHHEEGGEQNVVTGKNSMDSYLGAVQAWTHCAPGDGTSPYSYLGLYLEAINWWVDNKSRHTTSYIPNPHPNVPATFCNVSTVARPSYLEKTLNWTTRDYILFDKAENYFIYLKSVMSATKTSGSLTNSCTVSLEVETPQGSTSAIIFSGSLPLGSLLDYPDWKLGGTTDYIPTHAPRLFFNPLAFEQGSFPGLAHVTAGEIADGAAAASLIDFEIKLTEDDANDGNTAPTSSFFFAPRNLIEMLYAYVYTTDRYGQDETDRYPIINTTAYTFVMENIFKNWRIRIRNGTAQVWSGTLPVMYDATPAKIIGRT